MGITAFDKVTNQENKEEVKEVSKIAPGGRGRGRKKNASIVEAIKEDIPEEAKQESKDGENSLKEVPAACGVDVSVSASEILKNKSKVNVPHNSISEHGSPSTNMNVTAAEAAKALANTKRFRLSSVAKAEANRSNSSEEVIAEGNKETTNNDASKSKRKSVTFSEITLEREEIKAANISSTRGRKRKGVTK